MFNITLCKLQLTIVKVGYKNYSTWQKLIVFVFLLNTTSLLVSVLLHVQCYINSVYVYVVLFIYCNCDLIITSFYNCFYRFITNV